MKLNREMYSVRFHVDVPVVVRSSRKVSLPRWEPLAADGLIHTGKQFVFRSPVRADDHSGLELEHLLAQYGEWLTVWRRALETGWEYMVIADPQGYCPVFYAVESGTHPSVVVSPSFRSLTDTIPPRDVNWDLAATHLLGSHRVLEVAASEESFADGVKLLGADEALVIQSTGAQIVSRPSNIESASLDYETLVRRGIDRATQQLQSGVKQFGTAQFNLSGGRDSRVVLALAVAAGVQGSLSVITKDPRLGKPGYQQAALGADLEVASTLVAKFGLEWFEGARMLRHGVPLRRMIEMHQSYSSGWNYNAALSNFVALWDDTQLGLRGGAGELLRSSGLAETAESWVQEDSLDPPILDEQSAATIVDRFSHVSPKWGSVRQLDTTLLTETLLRWQGSTVRAAVNEYFKNFRQRAHFGHHLRSLGRGNEVTFHVLSQPEFMMAAALLSERDRNDGVLVFDIIEACSPTLNRMAFDDGQWADSVFDRSRLRNKRSPGIVEPSGSSYRQYQDAQVARKRMIPKDIVRHDGFEAARSIPVHDQASEWLRNTVFRIGSSGNGGSGISLDNVFEVAHSESRSLGDLVGKVATLSDIVGESDYRYDTSTLQFDARSRISPGLPTSSGAFLL